MQVPQPMPLPLCQDHTLRLDGFWSITEGLAALSPENRGLRELLGWREPARELSSA